METAIRVWLWDKLRVLDQLARIPAMFKDQLEVKLSDGIGDRLARARERLEVSREALDDGTGSVS